MCGSLGVNGLVTISVAPIRAAAKSRSLLVSSPVGFSTVCKLCCTREEKGVRHRAGRGYLYLIWGTKNHPCPFWRHL
jgi:hypothetical protein